MVCTEEKKDGVAGKRGEEGARHDLNIGGITLQIYHPFIYFIGIFL